MEYEPKNEDDYSRVLHERKSDSSGFTQVPNIVIRQPNISLSARSIYCILLSFSWGRDLCFPGLDTISTLTGLSKPMIIKYMKELVDWKLISIQRRGLGKSNIYWILDVNNAGLEDPVFKKT